MYFRISQIHIKIKQLIGENDIVNIIEVIVL